MAHVAFDILKFALDSSLATKNDLNEIKLEIKDLKADNKLIRWMVGFLLAGVASLIIKAFL